MLAAAAAIIIVVVATTALHKVVDTVGETRV